MRRTCSMMFALLVLLSVQPLGEGARSLDAKQPYLLLSTIRVGTMEKELNQAAANGYRLLGLWYTGQLAAVLEKSPEAIRPREYVVIDTGDAKDLAKELKQAADKGFRVVPGTFTYMGVGGHNAIRVVMEKVAGSPQRYDYFVGPVTNDYPYVGLIGHTPTGTLQKELVDHVIDQAAAGGYALVGMLSRHWPEELGVGPLGMLKKHVLRVEHILVGERMAGAQPRNPRPIAVGQFGPYRTIVGRPGGGLQEQLSRVAADGYRLVLGSTTDFPEIVLIAEQPGEAGEACESLLIGGPGPLTLQTQLNTAGEKGFRVFPAGVYSSSSDVAVVMTGTPRSGERYEYRLLDSVRKPSFDTEFAEMTAAGWAPITITLGGDFMLLERRLERRVELSEPLTELGPPATPLSTAVPSVSNQRYLSLSPGNFKIGPLQKELNEAAQQGYRVKWGSTFGDERSFMLEKVAEPPATYEYLALSERPSNLEEALNQGAARGFRLVSGVMTAKPGMWGWDAVVLMEKPPGKEAVPYRYRVLSTLRMSTFATELEQATREGWQSAGLLDAGEHVAILERPAAP